MKKVILTAAIAFGVLFGTGNIAFAKTSGGGEGSTVLNYVKDIREIEVHGNVQVFLTTGETDNVKVYDNYYADNALVQEENNVLRITSYGTKQLVVWVTASEITKLSAFDNAQIASFGKVSTLDLTVSLHNNATAQLDVDAATASFILHDQATADLTGNVETGTMHYDRSARLNAANLSAENLTESMMTRPVKHFHRVSNPVASTDDLI